MECECDMTKKRVLITGITGQVGSYLADRLHADGHAVIGVIRRASTFNTGRIEHLRDQGIKLVYGDVTDPCAVEDVFRVERPHWIFNAAAQSHVAVSYQLPVSTCHATGMGVLHVLEAMRKFIPESRLVQYSSSEMFGASPPPQNEDTPFLPVSPYAAAKVFGYHLVRVYRTSYNLWASNVIQFNAESERRGETFVTRKITRAVGRIKHGLQDKLMLGNLCTRRDWGYTLDYVEAVVRLMERQAEPTD